MIYFVLYLLVNGRASLCRVVFGRSFVVGGRNDCLEDGKFSDVSFMLRNLSAHPLLHVDSYCREQL